MKRLNIVIAMALLILVLSTVSCSLWLSEAELAYNDGVDSAEQGLYAEVIPDFAKAIQLDPDKAGAYNGRGFVYHALGQYQRAIEDFDKAIQLDPDKADLQRKDTIVS